MREIRFRAWDTEDKRWIEGDAPTILSTAIGFPKSVMLMQYTGLKDKNGKEIYEGDIVTNGYDIYQITFGKIGYDGSWNGLTGFGFKENEEKEGFMELAYYDDPKKLEVIGNIYEHPHLMEKQAVEGSTD